MDSYEVQTGGKRQRASEILEGIGGNPEVLRVIGDLYVGGGAEKTEKLRLFQLANKGKLADVEEALKKLGLEAPIQEMAIRSPMVLPDEILQQGEVVFLHTKPVRIPTDGHMLENLIILGWSAKRGMKELILRLKGMGFPAGTTFAGVIPQ